MKVGAEGECEEVAPANRLDEWVEVALAMSHDARRVPSVARGVGYTVYRTAEGCAERMAR